MVTLKTGNCLVCGKEFDLYREIYSMPKKYCDGSYCQELSHAISRVFRLMEKENITISWEEINRIYSATKG